MAILYLVNSPKISVQAITVDCVGETYCPQGAKNATKLLKLAGQAQIPVYYAIEPAETLAYQFPEKIREAATLMDVSGFNQLPGTANYSPGAVAELSKRLIAAGKAREPITIVSIGTSTNIAAAFELAEKNQQADKFRKGVAMIYKGGGAVGEPENGSLTNNNIPGNLTIPGIYTSNNKTAEWNIFANATATQVLFTSQLPVTLVAVNLSNQADITESSYKKLTQSASTEAARFVAADILTNINQQGGWGKAELDYWDPSVAVAAVNPDFVTTRYDHVAMCVDTCKGDTHGTTYVGSKCAAIKASTGLVTVFTGIDKDKFYREFIDTLNQSH